MSPKSSDPSLHVIRINKDKALLSQTSAEEPSPFNLFQTEDASITANILIGHRSHGAPTGQIKQKCNPILHTYGTNVAQMIRTRGDLDVGILNGN